MEFDNLISYILENYSGQTVMGYHGSEGNKEFDRPNLTGIWFTLASDNELMEYYSNRMGQKNNIIKARLNLGNCLDLTAYNTDYLSGIEEAGDFLRDMELNDNEIDNILDIMYVQGTDSEEWDDNGYPILALSNTLNYAIKTYLIPQHKFDSILIQEGQDHDTICMLNKNNIEIIF